jgi:hypothetical protein
LDPWSNLESWGHYPNSQICRVPNFEDIVDHLDGPLRSDACSPFWFQWLNIPDSAKHEISTWSPLRSRVEWISIEFHFLPFFDRNRLITARSGYWNQLIVQDNLLRKLTSLPLRNALRCSGPPVLPPSSTRYVREAERWCSSSLCSSSRHLSAPLELRLVSRWAIFGDAHTIWKELFWSFFIVHDDW